MKKALSMALSMALALSVAMPAFAADDDAPNVKKSDYTSTVQVPTLDVTIPTSAEVIINPYSMYVTDPNGGSDKVNDQIVSKEYVIINNGESALKVSYTVTGSVPSESKASFATASTTGGKSVKTEAYVYVQTTEAVVGGASETTAAAAVKTAFEGRTNASYDSKKDGLVAAAKSTTVKDVATLAAGKDKDGQADTTAKNAMGFRLNGDVNPNPTTAWTAGDKLAVSVAFTFNPTAPVVTTGT